MCDTRQYHLKELLSKNCLWIFDVALYWSRSEEIEILTEGEIGGLARLRKNPKDSEISKSAAAGVRSWS